MGHLHASGVETWRRRHGGDCSVLSVVFRLLNSRYSREFLEFDFNIFSFVFLVITFDPRALFRSSRAARSR